MPQMSPISWICLFILFSVTFMMFHTLNYFCFSKNINTMNLNKTNNFKENKNVFWKW